MVSHRFRSTDSHESRPDGEVRNGRAACALKPAFDDRRVRGPLMVV